MRDYKEYEYLKSIDMMLDTKKSQHVMTDEKTISRFRTEAYDNDFMKTMEMCDKWGEEKTPYRQQVIISEHKPDNNLFINGHCSVTITEPINSLIVVGDIDDGASITSEKVVHVSPEKSEEVLMRILENESQKGWTTKSEAKSGISRRDTSFYVKRANLLMKVFSSFLKSLEGVDDIQFVSYCKRISEYADKIKEETDKKKRG